jgi:hypothetical protein
MYDQSQAETLVAVVREAVAHSGVVEVSDHFAGYFDELGITITVNPRTSTKDIQSLKDKVVERLSLHRFPFKWMVMFTRAGKQVEILIPDE